MSYRTVMMKRRPDPHTVVTQEALERFAADLLGKGTITITDPDGEKHKATVEDAEVTERGVEVTLGLASTSDARSSAMADAFCTVYGRKQPPVSMGCTVEGRIPTGVPELDHVVKDGIASGEISKFYGKE